MLERLPRLPPQPAPWSRPRRCSRAARRRRRAPTLGARDPIGRPRGRWTASRSRITAHPLLQGTLIDAAGTSDGAGRPPQEPDRTTTSRRPSPPCASGPTRFAGAASTSAARRSSARRSCWPTASRRSSATAGGWRWSGCSLIGLVTLTATRSLWWAVVPILAGWVVWLATETILATLEHQALPLRRAAGRPDHRPDDARGQPPGDPLPRRPPTHGRRPHAPPARPSAPSPSPILWCALTGAIGYGALMTSNVVPIQPVRRDPRRLHAGRRPADDGDLARGDAAAVPAGNPRSGRARPRATSAAPGPADRRWVCSPPRAGRLRRRRGRAADRRRACRG